MGVNYYEVSAKTGTCIQESLEDIFEQAINKKFNETEEEPERKSMTLEANKSGK